METGKANETETPMEVTTDAVPVQVATEGTTDAEAVPPTKRARTEADASVEATDRLAMLESIAGKLPDAETQKQLYDLTSDMMETLVSTQEASRGQAERIQALEAIQRNNDKSIESSARATADLFGELFAHILPNYQRNEAQSTDFVNALKSSPKAMEFLKPIEVCASAIKQHAMTMQHQNLNAELVASRERVKLLQNQLGAYSRMGGIAPDITPVAQAPQQVPQVPQVPMWTPPNLAAMAPMASPAPVQVAASAHVAAAPQPQPTNGVQLPDILRKNMSSYSKSALSAQRVMPSDFDGPLIQKSK